jgi:hypothetical protein
MLDATNCRDRKLNLMDKASYDDTCHSFHLKRMSILTVQNDLSSVGFLENCYAKQALQGFEPVKTAFLPVGVTG